MSVEKQRVTCPSCGKGYRWQDSLVGRKVPCKQCGTKFTIPNAPGVGIAIQPAPVTKDVGYELDIDEPANTPAQQAAPTKNDKCPSCNSPVRPGAVLCMNCGFNMQAGEKVQTDVADSPVEPEESFDGMTKKQRREVERAEALHAQHMWSEYKFPMIAMIVGLALMVINNFILGPNTDFIVEYFGGHGYIGTALALTIATAFDTVIHGALLFSGLLLLVYLFGQAFGTLTSVLLRVFAVTILAQELDFMFGVLISLALGVDGMGYYISWFIYLVVMIVLCIKMFDLDIIEFRVLIWFIIIGRWVANMLLESILEAMFF